jgi:GT2 family glycosyltransferase
MSDVRLGLLINTRNEARNVQELTPAFTWFDEVVVADMESTDGTVEVASRAGARILPLPAAGYVEPGRQPALDAMTADWVVVLDADERITSEGVAELRERLGAVDEQVAALRVYRRTFLGAREITASGWGPRYERHLRVVRPGRTTWSVAIHAEPEVVGTVLDLPDDSAFTIVHENFRDLEHALEKFNRYSTVEADDLVKSGQPPRAGRGLLRGIKELRDRYSPEEDGAAGLGLAMGLLTYRVMVELKALEALGWPEDELPDREVFRQALLDFSEVALSKGDSDLAALLRGSAEIELEQARVELADKVAQLKRAQLVLDEREGERDDARKAHADAVAAGDLVNQELAGAAARSRALANQVDQADIELRRLREALLAADARTDRYRSLVADLREYVAEERAKASRARADLAVQVAAAEQLEASFVVGLMRRYRQRVERWAPAETRRRKSYSRLVGGTRTVLGGRKSPAVVPMEESSDPGYAFAASSAPAVSIVVPVHGHWDVTDRCLASIAAHPSDVPYEVIVVDDASPDHTASMLARVPGCRVVSLKENLGYVGACNAGIGVARGSYVLLLNNDTEVSAGWLEALVDIAEGDSSVGIVGAKLVYPDGTLQEAGSIIWKDGTGWNYGRNGDAEAYEVNYVRDVDYCSGACLLVRRSLLDDLGGLDEGYAPAYYDDSDLAFAARDRGFRVVYQPACVITHHEGVSHGTDTTSGIKRYQEINRHYFVEKWAKALQAQRESDPARVVLASRRPGSRGHVLVVDYQVPRFDRDSGSLRMTRLLDALLALGFSVTFLPDNRVPLSPYTSQLQQRGIKVAFGDVHERNLISSLAPELEFAILSRPSVAWRYVPLLRELSPATQVFFDTVDLHHVREDRRAELDGDEGRRKVASVWRELELGLVRSCDATLVVSPVEKAVLEAEVPGARIEVVSNIHEVRVGDVVPAGREGLLFVGGFAHPPNVDAALWFCDAVLPLIRRELPHVKLTLAGDAPPPEVLALAGPNVEVTGWVEDLDPLHSKARIFVAPLRYGAGVKGKIAESLALRLPIVSTAVGVEGMGLTDGTDVLVGDTAERFAAAVVRLYRDDELWLRLSDAGARRVDAEFSSAAVRANLMGLMNG